MDIAYILTTEFPGARWTLSGEEYAGLVWPDQETPKPSSGELTTLWNARVLPRAKARAKARVDEEAEALRLLWITPGVGQALTYRHKLEEARDALREGSPIEGNYPLLEAEADARGISVGALATLVWQTFAAWRTIAAAIEAKRMAAHVAINAAASEAEAGAAAVVDWSNIPRP